MSILYAIQRVLCWVSTMQKRPATHETNHKSSLNNKNFIYSIYENECKNYRMYSPSELIFLFNSKYSFIHFTNLKNGNTPGSVADDFTRYIMPEKTAHTRPQTNTQQNSRNNRLGVIQRRERCGSIMATSRSMFTRTYNQLEQKSPR